MESCSARIGSRSFSALVMSSALRVVEARHGPQLGGLLFGSRVIQEIAATDLRSGEILEEPGLAERRGGLHLGKKSHRRPPARPPPPHPPPPRHHLPHPHA